MVRMDNNKMTIAAKIDDGIAERTRNLNRDQYPLSQHRIQVLALDVDVIVLHNCHQGQAT
jgi:hypothetical protein